MAKAYGEDAIETCRGLYLKYGGGQHDLIQADMRKAGYAGWSKINLHDRGREGTRGERMGWITKFGFERSLELHIQKLAESVNDDEQDLYVGIKKIRKRLETAAIGSKASKDDLAKYRDFCKLEIDARRNLDLSRDNLDTFVSCYEKLTLWLAEIDPAAGKALAKNGERLVELANAHYGKPEESDDGASPGEDESGDGPPPAEDHLGLVG